MSTTTAANDLSSTTLRAYNERMDTLLGNSKSSSSCADFVAFCADLIHDAVLFRELSTVDDEIEASEMWISSRLQADAEELLGRFCTLMHQHGVRRVINADEASAVPGALSLMMLFSRAKGDASKAVQAAILDAMEAIVDQSMNPAAAVHPHHGDVDRQQTNTAAQFHWTMAAAIMTQSQHRTSSVKLARYCEIIAMVPMHDTKGEAAEDRLGVVDVIKRCAETTSNASLTAKDTAMLERVALRLLAFSLSSRSRRCVLVESSGRFYSELGRLGMVLPKLALHGSDTLLSIACALLNVLSDDHGRMFDADPSIGEFFSVVIRELLDTNQSQSTASNHEHCSPAAVAEGRSSPQVEAMQSRDCWATRGVRNWNIEMVLRNNDISTGHKMNGAVAIKIKALQGFFCAMGASQHHLHPGVAVLLRSLRNVFHDARLLETGVSVVIRNIAVCSVREMLQAATANNSSNGGESSAVVSRALMHHFKLTMVMLANIIRDGGSHQTASALLLLTQGASSSVCDEEAASTCGTDATTTATGDRRTMAAAPSTLLQGLMSTLSVLDDGHHPPRCRSLVLMQAINIFEAAWRQSPRDFAPHLIDAHVLQVAHAATSSLFRPRAASDVSPSVVDQTVDHCGTRASSAALTQSCVDDMSITEVMHCLRKVCAFTVEVVETHATLKECLEGDAAALCQIVETCVRLWTLAGRLGDSGVINDASGMIEQLAKAAPATTQTVLSAIDAMAVGLLDTCLASDNAGTVTHLNNVEKCHKLLQALVALAPAAGVSGADSFTTRIEARQQRIANKIVQHAIYCADDEWSSFRNLAWYAPHEVPMDAYVRELHKVLAAHPNDSDGVLARAFDRLVWFDNKPLDLNDTKMPVQLINAYVFLVLHMDSRQCKHQLLPSGFVTRLRDACTKWGVPEDVTGEQIVRATVLTVLASVPDIADLARSAAILRYLLPLSRILGAHVSTSDLKRMLDVALRCIKPIPDDIAAQATLIEVLKQALWSWKALQGGDGKTMDANETLSAWLAAADVVTVAVHALEATYNHRWGAVPLHIAVHVYALHCVLTQGASKFRSTMNPKGSSGDGDTNPAATTTRATLSLWEEIMSRVQGVLAESVMKFLLSVPSMPHACVTAALPLLESLAFQVTQLMSDAGAVTFWIRIARDGVIKDCSLSDSGDGNVRRQGVERLWLLRLFNTIISASQSGPEVVDDADSQQRAANLTLLGFQILDVIIGHADALSATTSVTAEAPQSVDQITESLSTAETLMTVAWTALDASVKQPAAGDDSDSPFTPHATLQYAARSHKLFLQENGLSQHAVLPLMQVLANPNLSSDEFYNRARNGVFGALRCTLAAARYLDGISNNDASTAAAWRSTTTRISIYGCTALQQLSFLNAASLSAVSGFIANEEGMEAFLNRTTTANATDDAWNCSGVVSEVIPSTVDASICVTNGKRLCLGMMQSAADTARAMEWRAVACEVERVLVLEAEQLNEDLRSAITFDVVVTPEILARTGRNPSKSIGGTGQHVVLFDATVFLTEMLHRLGTDVFFKELDGVLNGDLFAFVQVDGLPHDSSHSDNMPNAHHHKEQVPKKGHREPTRSNHGRTKFQQGPKATKKGAAGEHGKPNKVGEKAPPAATKGAAAQAPKLSKLYVCVRRQSSSIDECQIEDALWCLNRLGLPEGERNSLMFMMARPLAEDANAAATANSAPLHPFVEYCRRDALAACGSTTHTCSREERKRIVSECCRKGFTLLLVSTILRHCASVLQRSGSFVSNAMTDPDAATTNEVLELLSGCFQYVAYFNQHDLALSMKAAWDPLRKDADLLRNELTAFHARGRSVHQSHQDEDAFSLLLVLLACQMMSLSDLASCKASFNYRGFGELRLDRYGAADDRESFNDESDVSDNTLSQDNDAGDEEDAFRDALEGSFASSSPDAIFAATGSSGSSAFDNVEDEDEDVDSTGTDGSVEIEADEYDRMRHAETAKRHLARCLDKLLHMLQAEIASSSHRIAYTTLAAGRERRTVSATMLQTDVPLGENGRWSRYYNHVDPASNIDEQLCFLVDLRHAGQLSVEGSTSSGRAHCPNDAIAALADAIAPLLSLRGRRAQRTLHHIVELVSQLDTYMMSMLTQLMTVADRTPRTRLFVLRLVYTVTSSGKRRSIARAAPAASMDEVQPFDVEKVEFLRRLLDFLSAPTMSVLSQRMITYIMTSAYSLHDDVDDFNDDELDEAGDYESSDGWEAASQAADAEGVVSTTDSNADLNEADMDEERSLPRDDSGAEEHFSSAAAKLRRIISSTVRNPDSPLRPRVQLADERKANVTAPHVHPLFWTNTWDIPDYRGYTCDVCSKSCHGYSYHCGQCMYDECLHCVLSTMQQRPISNDDFDVGGGPYYEPTNDYEAEERHRSSSSNFAHDQFHRLCAHTTPRVWELLLRTLEDANCVDGCTDFLTDAVAAFVHAAMFPWEHPSQSKQPPFLPRIARDEVFAEMTPFVAKWTNTFLGQRMKGIEAARRAMSSLQAPQADAPLWSAEDAGPIIFAMDSLHAEAQHGSQVYQLLPLCVELCVGQHHLTILDGLLQKAWDTLIAHYELLTTVLKNLDERVHSELYGVVTMSQGNFTLLVVIGKYYRAINWRNSYLAAANEKLPAQRQHNLFFPLTCTAGPSELRTESTMLLIPSTSELFGFDEPPQSQASLGPAQLSTSEVVQHMKKSELVLELLARRRSKGLKATDRNSRPPASGSAHTTGAGTGGEHPSRPGTAAAATAAKEVKSEMEDPWNEQRSEEIASIVGFAKAYRTALNFLIASRNDPNATLDEGIDFLLNSSKILDFSIRLAAFRAKMIYFHDNSEDQLEITVSRTELLVSTFREMFGFEFDAAISKENALITQIDVSFSDEEAMDAGGVKREWLTLVFQRIIQLTDQAEATTHPPQDAVATDEGPPPKQLLDTLDDDFPKLFVRSGDTSGSAFELNPAIEPSEELMSIAKATGMLIGIALSYDVPIDLHLTRAMYSHMIGRQPNLKDLEATDPDLYKNLRYITELQTEEEMEALCLAFTAPCVRGDQLNGEIALVPNGADIPVTLGNRNDYIRRRADHRMTKQSRHLMLPLLEGFHLTMPIGFLQCFTAEDVELVSCGVSSVDVEDLRAHSAYEGYQVGSPQVRWFWECCSTMPQQDLVKLVQFATASTRPPAGGFASLHPPLTLVRCPESANLPVAHTCMNRIDLPEYPNAVLLREKLKQALALGNVGFGLV